MVNYTPWVFTAAIIFTIWKLIIQPRINAGKPIEPDKKKEKFNFQDYVQPLGEPEEQI
jgi:hypothetical protein